MKVLRIFVSSMLFVAVAVAPVSAQQPGPPTDPHQLAPPPATSTTPPTPGPGMRPDAMPMMDMCRQMMAGMGGMMGMPSVGGGAPTDPKERAEMLEMRGEMMKAMGDIMLKHARRMQGTLR
jgi:hypothetical protein